MIKIVAIAIMALALAVTTAFAGDPIVGTWKSRDGDKARVIKCGQAFCVKLASGKHAGKTVGKVQRKGDKYVGTLTSPEDQRNYSGSAEISGAAMKLTGCAGVFCGSQVWVKL